MNGDGNGIVIMGLELEDWKFWRTGRSSIDFISQ